MPAFRSKVLAYSGERMLFDVWHEWSDGHITISYVIWDGQHYMYAKNEPEAWKAWAKL